MFKTSAIAIVMMIAALVAVPAARADVLVASYFDADTENWSATGDVHGLAYNAADGNPAGSFHAVDDATGSVWFFVAPAKFHGDLTAAYGYSLSYDIRVTRTDSRDWNSPDVTITGAGETLQWRGSLGNRPTPDAWSHYEALLETDSWTKASDGLNPTESEFLAVLADVTDLTIRGEYYTGNDQADLDNVALVPEPASLSLLLIGAALLRRRQS